MNKPEELSLRDWYAGVALGGLCANPVILETMGRREDDITEMIELLTTQSNDIADAMMKERPKGNKGGKI